MRARATRGHGLRYTTTALAWLAALATFGVGCRRHDAEPEAAYPAWGPGPAAPAPAPVAWGTPAPAPAPPIYQQGRASYYADSLAGNPTASGQPYDPRGWTAAHRTLPFGTVVEVVRLDTGGRVTVRINDRGPFGDERRIIDLSRTAAEALGMMKAGVVDVTIHIVGQAG